MLVLALDAHLGRVTQVALGDALDAVGHGGGEQGDLLFLGHVAQDLFHVIDKAHAQHFIGFIQYHGPQLVQLEGAAIQVILDTTGCADDRMHATPQLPQLVIHALAAIHRQHMKALQVTGVGLHGLGDLQRQLTCGRQYQQLGFGQGHVHATEQGQGEGRGLTGAGLGLANQVTSFQQRRDGPKLNGGRGLVANVLDGGQHGSSQAEIGKARGGICRHEEPAEESAVSGL